MEGLWYFRIEVIIYHCSPWQEMAFQNNEWLVVTSTCSEIEVTLTQAFMIEQPVQSHMAYLFHEALI